MNQTQAIRVGLIGCGAYGRRTQLPILLSLPGVRVAALSNRSEKPLTEALAEAQQAGHQPRAHREWRAVVDDPSVDAVVATLPPEFNLPIVRAADAVGKPVLIEKPVAATVSDLQQIEKLARRRRIHIQVGTQVLFSDWFGRFREAVGAMGPLLAVNSQVYVGDGWVFQDQPWKLKRETSGGILNSWGVHPLGLMLRLAGGFDADYTELTAYTGTAMERAGELPGVDPTMYDTLSASWVTLRQSDSDDATPCQLFLAAHRGVTGGTWRLEAICTGGRVEGDVWARTLCVHRLGQPAERTTLPAHSGPGHDGNRQALEFFLRCVRRRQTDHATLRLGITACRFALEVNVSPPTDDGLSEEEMPVESQGHDPRAGGHRHPPRKPPPEGPDKPPPHQRRRRR